jgi:hypothetical protein
MTGQSRRRDAWLDAHGPCWTCFRRRTHRSSFELTEPPTGSDTWARVPITGPLQPPASSTGAINLLSPPSTIRLQSGINTARFGRGKSQLHTSRRRSAYATRWRVAASLLLHRGGRGLLLLRRARAAVRLASAARWDFSRQRQVTIADDLNHLCPPRATDRTHSSLIARALLGPRVVPLRPGGEDLAVTLARQGIPPARCGVLLWNVG